jgi:hypothetical protein
VVLFATEAHTSQRNEEVDLAELVRSSDVIVIAEPADPPVKKTPISFPGRKNVSGEPLPEFVRTQQRYVVREVLGNRSGQPLAVGAVIEVDQAQFGTRRTVFERYYFEGVRKIPIYRTYFATTQPPKAATGSWSSFRAAGMAGSTRQTARSSTWAFVIASSES